MKADRQLSAKCQRSGWLSKELVRTLPLASWCYVEMFNSEGEVQMTRALGPSSDDAELFVVTVLVVVMAVAVLEIIVVTAAPFPLICEMETVVDALIGVLMEVVVETGVEAIAPTPALPACAVTTALVVTVIGA